MVSSLYKGIKILQNVTKSVHTPGAQVLTSVHLAVKMCTPLISNTGDIGIS